jgi:uncharacterized protein YhfF
MAHPLLIAAFWQEYLASLPPSAVPPADKFEVWHFCDNQPDADELGELARGGVKTATASALGAYLPHEPLPVVGGLSIITNWAGEPLILVETTEVEIVPFNQVGARQAYDEGEGSRSLDYWREVHWICFGRDLRGLGKEPAHDMPVVCEHFRILYSRPDSSKNSD